MLNICGNKALYRITIYIFLLINFTTKSFLFNIFLIHIFPLIHTQPAMTLWPTKEIRYSA